MSRLLRSLTALLLFLLLSGCASDPFEDITLESRLIYAKDIDEIKMELRPGFLVRGKLKDKTEFRLEVAVTDGTAIHGTRGEKIRFDKLEYVEYITPADYAVLTRASRLILAALAAVVFFIAGLADAIVRLISGS